MEKVIDFINENRFTSNSTNDLYNITAFINKNRFTFNSINDLYNCNDFDNITELDFYSDCINELKNLPKSLIKLCCCEINKDIKLPILPESLKILRISKCYNITSKLPHLPKNLKTLYIYETRIPEIELPPNLRELSIDYEKTEIIGILPTSLSEINGNWIPEIFSNWQNFCDISKKFRKQIVNLLYRQIEDDIYEFEE